MIYLVSDTHFAHKNILLPNYCNRGAVFNDVYHMDRYIINKWNEMISPEDTVFFLGDFSMNKIFVPKIVPQLNGIKISIQGNHDKAFRGSERWTQFFLDAGFSQVYPYNVHPSLVLQDESGVYQFKLSHLPYEVFDNRYKDILPEDKGMPLLHGHSHLTPEKRVRFSSKGTFMLDCGIDGTAPEYRPISETEVLKIYKEAINGLTDK